jgi:hypothetical protein
MKALVLLVLGLSVGIWAVRRVRGADPRRPVSEHWRRQQTRSEWSQGIDGPCWRFPVNKIKDEHGQFNAARLRKRA